MSSLRSIAFGALAVTTFAAADAGHVRAQTPRPPEAVGDSAAPAAADKAPDAAAPPAASPPPSGTVSAPATPAAGGPGKSAQKSPMKPGEAKHVTVQFTYDSRILVPHGADLKISIQGAATQILKTKHDAPPYTAILKIRPDATFPLKASAVLVSSIGHQFAADFEIKQENLTGAPLDVTLNAK